MELHESLEQEIAAERVRAFAHPSLPLTGYNYTETTQFDRLWNDINSQCRGLILDPHRVIARPFGKFFNYEELNEQERQFTPNDIETISTKEDGSLIIAFYYHGWHLCTRGSFTSDQAILAKEIWDANPKFLLANTGCTYLFELVGPGNHNVCYAYTSTQLVLLSIIQTQNGYEFPRQGVERYAEIFGINIAKEWKWNNDLFEYVKNNSDPAFEGLVIKLKSGLRFKLKSQLYCQLHRVMTGTWTPKRTLDLWESKRFGQFIIDPNIPDEYYAEINVKLNEVQVRYDTWETSQQALVRQMATVLLSNEERTLPEMRKYLAINFPEGRAYLSTLFAQGTDNDFAPFEQICYELFRKEEL